MSTKVSRIAHKVKALEDSYNRRLAERNLLIQQKENEETKIGSQIAIKKHLEEVSMLLVKTADASREAGRLRMEKVVTRALQSVFGPDFTFEIEMDESGGRPIAKFLVCSIGENGEVVKNEPQDNRGGGINDIVAFALQVAVLVVYNEPKIQGPIILDEPGKHVSEEFVVKFGDFLNFISKTFNRQINMVTHQPHLAATADKTLVSQLVGGRTVIKEQVIYDFDTEETTGESTQD